MLFIGRVLHCCEVYGMCNIVCDFCQPLNCFYSKFLTIMNFDVL